MELGLSLGSEASNPLGLMEKPREVTTKEGSLGFCMDTSTSPNNYGDIKHEQSSQQQQQEEEDVQGKESVNIMDKFSTSDHSNEDEAKRESDKEIGHHHKSCPIQLDLLPNIPVLRRNLHNNSLLSSHTLLGNRNSEVVECSIKLENIGRGMDMKRVQPKVVVDLDLTNHQHHRGEEAVAINNEDSTQNSGATSMFRMDFSLFNNINKFGGNTVNEGDHDEDDDDNCYKHCERRRASSRASEEEEEEEEDEKRLCTRKKLRLSKEQSAFLEESFKEHSTINSKQKLALAKQLNLRPRQVEVWFQNRRARTKLKQTEVDCESLKRCYETLTEENRRLHKEIQELRALKTSNPLFYNQLPATTLTMCPSCEKILTTTTTNNTNNIKNNNNVSKPTELRPTRPWFNPFSQT